MSENPKSPKSFKWKLGVLVLALLSLLFFLLFKVQNSGTKPEPEVDYVKAKGMSDGAVNDLIQHDVKDLSNRLDLGFHTMVQTPEDLDKALQGMYKTYGRPLDSTFKIAKAGKRVDGNWQRPSRTFYYAVKTTRYPMGQYFLKIEVVPAFSGGFVDVSGFGIFTFKNGKVPDYLK